MITHDLELRYKNKSGFLLVVIHSSVSLLGIHRFFCGITEVRQSLRATADKKNLVAEFMSEDVVKRSQLMKLQTYFTLISVITGLGVGVWLFNKNTLLSLSLMATMLIFYRLMYQINNKMAFYYLRNIPEKNGWNLV